MAASESIRLDVPIPFGSIKGNRTENRAIKREGLGDKERRIEREGREGRDSRTKRKTRAREHTGQRER
jgi:hypothetical protein